MDKIVISEHAKTRCKESGVSVGFLEREVSRIPALSGYLHWRTSKGVIILEKTPTGRVVVKTFIAKFKYKGKKYHKGVKVRR